RALSTPGLLASVAVSAVGLLLRALRYRLLLGRPVPLWPLVLVTAVRNMAVDLVPARAGAAASYLYLITARLGLPLEAGVASFALSFILDTLAVAPLLVFALLVVGSAPMPPAVLVGGGLVILLASVGGPWGPGPAVRPGGALVILLASVAARWALAPLLRLGARIAQRLPGGVRRLVPLLEAAADEGARRERARARLPEPRLSL